MKTLPPDVLAKGPAHPMVVRNPGTGKPTLWLTVRRDAAIPGMEPNESAALLTELWISSRRRRIAGARWCAATTS